MISGKLFGGIFKNKTVLITGHTGFQGSWLSLWLNVLGAKVIGYALEPPTNPSLFNILELEKKIIHNKGDVRDIHALQKVIKNNNPEFIFHLAAQPIVRFSYNFPVETFEINIMGTINVLEAIRNTDVKVCEIITSDKCYENRNKILPHNENDPLGGDDPYSASKGAAEIVTASYRNSFFNLQKISNTAIASVRAGNVIGGGDWANDRIVPDSIRQLISGQPIQIRNPDSIRPWQFVLESISGMLLLASKMYENSISYSESWNFGPDDSMRDATVQELVNMIIDKWGSGNSINVSNSNESHESKSLRLDSTKAKKLLGWHSVYSLNEAILETVNWYKSYSTKTIPMMDLTINQIIRYAAKAKEMNVTWAIDS